MVVGMECVIETKGRQFYAVTFHQFYTVCFVLHRHVQRSKYMSQYTKLICLFDQIFQEFNIEKLQLVEAEKKKIRQEYDRKQKQVEVRKKM